MKLNIFTNNHIHSIEMNRINETSVASGLIDEREVDKNYRLSIDFSFRVKYGWESFSVLEFYLYENGEKNNEIIELHQKLAKEILDEITKYIKEEELDIDLRENKDYKNLINLINQIDK